MNESLSDVSPKKVKAIWLTPSLRKHYFILKTEALKHSVPQKALATVCRVLVEVTAWRQFNYYRQITTRMRDARAALQPLLVILWRPARHGENFVREGIGVHGLLLRIF